MNFRAMLYKGHVLLCQPGPECVPLYANALARLTPGPQRHAPEEFFFLSRERHGQKKNSVLTPYGPDARAPIFFARDAHATKKIWPLTLTQQHSARDTHTE